MDNHEYTEKDLSKFTVRYSSSKLTAEQVGIVISQTAVMYKIIQEYLDSPYDLQVVQISRGSYIFDFLGDHVVLDQVLNICNFIRIQVSEFWGYIGSNVTWDLTKYIGVEVLRKKTELNKSEAESFTRAILEHHKVAIETNSIVEYDYKNEKIIQYNGKMASEYIKYHKDDANSRANFLAEHNDISLPPRRKTTHKRK